MDGFVDFKEVPLLHQLLHLLPAQGRRGRTDPLPTPHACHDTSTKLDKLLYASQLCFCRSAPDRDAVQNVRKDMCFYDQFQHFTSEMVAESVKRNEKGVALFDSLSNVNVPGHTWVNSHSKQSDGRRRLGDRARYSNMKGFSVFYGLPCADDAEVSFGRVHF